MTFKEESQFAQNSEIPISKRNSRILNQDKKSPSPPKTKK